jgi:hypothetical protein
MQINWVSWAEIYHVFGSRQMLLFLGILNKLSNLACNSNYLISYIENPYIPCIIAEMVLKI